MKAHDFSLAEFQEKEKGKRRKMKWNLK